MENLKSRESGGLADSMNNTGDLVVQASQINLPKGGGWIKSIDEKFLANAANGTASFTTPLPFVPARSFAPALIPNNNSGSDFFRLGWSSNLSSIKRKAENELPEYLDQDMFTLPGTKDMLPEFKRDVQGDLMTRPGGNFLINESPFTHLRVDYHVTRFRNRLEGLFSRIERWQSKPLQPHISGWSRKKTLRLSMEKTSEQLLLIPWIQKKISNGFVNMCTTIREIVRFTTTRIATENRLNGNSSFASADLKRIRYRNITPSKTHEDPLPTQWMFETVFDFGNTIWQPLPAPKSGTWPSRPIPFRFIVQVSTSVFVDFASAY